MAGHPQEKFVVLTQGYSNPVTAKTGASFIRYRTEDVLAVLDAEHAGKSAAEILDAGPNIPVVATLEEVPEANALLIGTAPTGGRLPEAWRTVVQGALRKGMHVVSGLHDFLGDDPELSSLAAECGATITDVRRNSEQDVSQGEPLGNVSLRIHTMGNDCSLGKMVVTIELDRALRKQGHDSKFLATGQTGIMISGDGVPIDRVIADFVSGAAEKLVLRNKQHEFLLIEGQGSLAHPMYSAVTLGLLHGCQPQGLILCYEAGREYMGGVKGRRLVSLAQLRQACETIGRLVHPTEAIGVAMNGRNLSVEEAEIEKQRVHDELGLPVCDVFRDGPEALVQAILNLRERLPS
jgi:uncharacterized NAD-dependent epimerase/dehydratase family protein